MDTKHPEKIERQPSDVPNASSPGMHSRQISTVSQLSYADGEWAENGGDDFQLDQTLGDVSTLFTNSEAGGKKALNWKKYLKDEKLALDALKFQKSRKNPVQDHPGIAKDLPRTRPDDPYFQKSSNVNALREIACFFCSSNNINYQQGLLEIIVPFLKLRSTTFRTKHCYAYFSSFMRNYFPNILIPTVVNDLKELPHLNAAINYCGILLGYHGNEIANILKVTDLDLRTFVTPWIMTLFSKGTNMDLIYEIFDRYMAENDKLFLFYMVVSLILMKKKEIVEMNDTGDDVKLITYLNRTLKDESLQTLQDVDQLFTIAKKIKELTPLSFETALKQLGLMNVGILSIQEFNEYLSMSIPSTMEIYPFEVVNYLLEKTALDQSDKEKYQIYPKAIEFKVLDCRKMRGAGMLPNAIELPESSIKTDEALRSYLIEMCKAETETHICILKSNDTDKEEQTIVANVIKILRSFNKNYVSIVLGGYKAIIKEMDQRKVNIPLARRKRLSVFDQIKSIFGK